jgi:O-antigen/teichoic acid export membrane protein
MAFSVRRGLAWMLLSQGGLFIIQFSGSVVLARLLTPYEMGIYAVAYAVVGILSTLRALGLSNFLVREHELRPDIVRTCFTINAILVTATAAVIAILSHVGGALLGDAGVGRVLVLLTVPPLLSILELVPLARLERIGAFRLVALINLAKVSTTTGVTILLATLGFSYMSIAWGTLAAAALGVICVNIAGRRFVSLRFGLHEWRSVTRFGVQILMIGAMGNIANRCSDLLLGRVVGLSALGLYSRASGLNGLLWDNIHVVIARVVFVDFSERRRRSLPLRESYLRVVAMVIGLLWPASAGMAILAGPIVLTIYGPNWVEAAPILSLLAIGGLIGSSLTMVYEIYLVTGETERLFRRESVRNGISLGLFSLGCLGGMLWAAASRIGDNLVAFLIYRTEISRLTKSTVADVAPVYRQAGMLTVAACAPAAILMMANNWSPHTPLPLIFGAIGLGVVTWGGVLWCQSHPLFIEAEAVSRQFFWRYVRGV